MARQFYFSNEKNEIYDLMGRFTDFLNAPTGLGMSLEIETVQLEKSLKPLNKKSSFNDIQGEMLFKEYKDYESFSKYISSSTNIYFHQKINTDIKEAYLLCDVIGLEKTEKDVKTGYLKCPITIKPYTMWQVEKSILIESYEDDGESSGVLPYILPFKLGKDSATSSIIQQEVVNNGVVSTDLILIIKGISKNPEWYLNIDTPLSSGLISITVQLNQVVVVNGTEGYMRTYSGDAILDNYLSPIKKNYITIPVGTSQLFLKNIYEGEVRWIEYYYTI